MDDAVIEIEDLSVVRGRRPVLDGLSLRVASGSVTGLLGPSGCGKLTLMRAIVGVQIVGGGRVTVLGDLAGSPELRRHVGYMTQAPSVYGDLSISENLRYFAAVVGVGHKRIGEVCWRATGSRSVSWRRSRRWSCASWGFSRWGLPRRMGPGWWGCSQSAMPCSAWRWAYS